MLITDILNFVMTQCPRKTGIEAIIYNNLIYLKQ